MTQRVDGPEIIGQPPASGAEVTVVVPTFNHERFIESCIDSVLRQVFDRGFQVVVHDDASTDNTAQILRRIASENPERVRVILQESNQMRRGVSGAELYLLDIDTPYFAFCEGDDEWIDEFKLEKQWRFMQRNPWCVLLHHEVEISDEGGGSEYAIELRDYLDHNRPTAERVTADALSDGNWIMTCSTMFRTSALRKSALAAIGEYQPEDYILFSLAADSGDIGFMPDVMAKYRLHGANYWSGLPAETRAQYDIDVQWFFACHLTGEGRARAQARLLESLAAMPTSRAFSPFVRLREQLAELTQDRIVLLERVRHLEEKESWLMHELALDVESTAVRHSVTPKASEGEANTQVHLVTGVWDNADLLPGWLRHHRGMGVAGVVAMDYGSTDGSMDILRSPEWSDFVTLIPFTGLDTDTNLAMLEFARHMELPGWGLMIDPDEFLFTPTGRVHHESVASVMGDHDLITLPRFHMTASRSVAENDAFVGVRCAVLREATQDQGKVLVRIASDASTDMSGHTGAAARAVEIAGVETCLLHVPVRSYDKFAEKVDHAEVTLAADPSLPEWFAHHWRRWVQKKNAGTLRDEYLEQFIPDSEVPVLLGAGTIIRDERLQEVD